MRRTIKRFFHIAGLAKLALDGVNERKGQTLALAGTVAIGICSILVLVSLVNGIRDFLSHELTGAMKDTLLEVSPGKRVLDEAARDEIAAMKGIFQVYRENEFAGKVKVKIEKLDMPVDLKIYGIERSFFKDDSELYKKFQYREGSTTAPIVLPNSFYILYRNIPLPEAVPKDGTKEELLQFLKGQIILNDSIHVATSDRKKKIQCNLLAFSETISNPGLYVPLPYVHRWNAWWQEEIGSRPRLYNRFIVTADSSIGLTPVEEAIRARGFRVKPAARQQIYDQINETSSYITIGSFIIGGVTLLIAAVAIIGGLTSAVREQAGRIGLMRATGARRRDVVAIFLAEAGTIGILGVGFGQALGAVTMKLLDNILGKGVQNFLSGAFQMPDSLFVRPPWLAVGSVVFGLSLSLLAGLLPAWRAARIEPAIALREN